MTKVKDRKQHPEITLETPVEDLARQYPATVGFLTRHTVRCIRCGEPLWCTLGELFKEEGVMDPQQLLDELNVFLLKDERA